MLRWYGQVAVLCEANVSRLFELCHNETTERMLADAPTRDTSHRNIDFGPQDGCSLRIMHDFGSDFLHFDSFSLLSLQLSFIGL